MMTDGQSANLFGALLLLELLGVKVQLSSLENVTIATAGLAGSGGDAGEQTAGAEGVVKGGVEHTALGLEGELSLGMLGLLLSLETSAQGRTRRACEQGND